MALLKPLTKIIVVLLLIFLLAELAYATLLRPWVLRWGASDAEVQMTFPGDIYIDSSSVTSTRAITIQAPVSQVWPWVLQLGQERGGFYSYTFFENLFGANMVNADRPFAPRKPHQGWRSFLIY